MSEIVTLTVDENSAGMRLDSFIADSIEELTRSMAAKLIADNAVAPAYKSSHKMAEGEVIEVTLPEPEVIDAVPENIPLDILYEDSDVIVVNKPKGMVVHPDNTHTSGTIVNALLYHCKDLSGVGGALRPGIVHRIDMDTTGSVIACKNDRAHNSIAAQLKEHSVTRKYVAIVVGNIPQDEGVVDAPIGRSEKDRKKMAINKKNGKRAVTHYRVLERFGDFTYVECQLETGRTHQIRVHMSSINHPLLGDTVYGIEKINKKYKNLRGQCLHAMVLGFQHPVSGEYIETTCPLPEYFVKLLEALRH